MICLRCRFCDLIAAGAFRMLQPGNPSISATRTTAWMKVNSSTSSLNEENEGVGSICCAASSKSKAAFQRSAGLFASRSSFSRKSASVRKHCFVDASTAGVPGLEHVFDGVNVMAMSESGEFFVEGVRCAAPEVERMTRHAPAKSSCSRFRIHTSFAGIGFICVTYGKRTYLRYSAPRGKVNEWPVGNKCSCAAAPQPC